MKKMLKLFPLLLIAILGISMAACSDKDEDEPMSSSDLPTTAKDFIVANFPSSSIISVVKDKTEYDVVLSDGTKIEFNKDGEWMDVDAAPTKALPSGFYPDTIDKYVAENYEGFVINEISKVNTGFEVDLTNDVELLFGKEGNFISMKLDR